VSERPALAGVLGALTIAFTAILVAKASVAPAAAALWRCAYALPVLAALAFAEQRRFGARTWRERRLATAAGAVFAVNMVIWHYAIRDIGAGLSTVLGNVQVVVVPFLAWAILRERVPRSILVALPLVCLGVLFVSGALENGAYGANPPRGVAFAAGAGLLYATFLLIQREGSMDLRRPAGALLDMTIAATVTALIVSLILGGDDLVPVWPSAGWLILLALTSQVLGWWLITVSLPRLPAAMTSMILTIQPIGSMILGAVLLSEAPSSLQITGCTLILLGLVSVGTMERAAVRARRA